MTKKDLDSVELPLVEEKLRRIQIMMERTENIAQTGSWEWDAMTRFYFVDHARDSLATLATGKDVLAPSESTLSSAPRLGCRSDVRGKK